MGSQGTSCRKKKIKLYMSMSRVGPQSSCMTVCKPTDGMRGSK